MKELIKECLETDEVIDLINKKRVNYPHMMSEFYFFKIMIEVLKQYNFICSISKEHVLDPISFEHVKDGNTSRIRLEGTLYIFKKGEFDIEPLRSTYDCKDLANKLLQLNKIQGNFGIGMRESARTLVDIFLNLL